MNSFVYKIIKKTINLYILILPIWMTRRRKHVFVFCSLYEYELLHVLVNTYYLVVITECRKYYSEIFILKRKTKASVCTQYVIMVNIHFPWITYNINVYPFSLVFFYFTTYSYRILNIFDIFTTVVF